MLLPRENRVKVTSETNLLQLEKQRKKSTTIGKAKEKIYYNWKGKEKKSTAIGKSKEKSATIGKAKEILLLFSPNVFDASKNLSRTKTSFGC